MPLTEVEKRAFLNRSVDAPMNEEEREFRRAIDHTLMLRHNFVKAMERVLDHKDDKARRVMERLITHDVNWLIRLLPFLHPKGYIK
jgi:hypothetical protein